MKTTLYTIECISNLHVGNGQDNDGVIDKLIQKDVVSGFPCINSSSLKGALREHCEAWNNKHENTKVDIERIFGKKVNGAENCAPGAYRFLDAMLLSIPRPTEDQPYVMMTCDAITNELVSRAEALGLSLGQDAEAAAAAVLKLAKVEAAGKCGFAKFQNYVSDEELPVIARNRLENGQSKNLWYEQVLPRKSRLAFFVMHGGEIDGHFNAAVTSTLVQIGANATVGYGICKIHRITVNE